MNYAIKRNSKQGKHMTTTNALEALRALAKQQYKPKGQPEIEKPTVPVPAAVKPHNNAANIRLVEIDTDRNRIDIYFNYVPSDSQRYELKQRSWRYNPDRVCWYHKYNRENVQYLNLHYGQDIDFIPSDNVPMGMTIETVSVPIPEPVPQVLESDPASPFEQYKKQVKDLCEALKVDPADLALIAVSKLHDQVFT